MQNAALYILTVLIWGTTWFAIKLQLNGVAVEASIVYRFTIAATVLFTILLFSRKLQSLSLRDHFFCVLQGACLFSLNFYFFYSATEHIVSGLSAVVMSVSPVFNSINLWLFFHQRPSVRVIAGSLLGMAGICTMFWPEINMAADPDETVTGILLAAMGTTFFSLANMISIRHQRNGLTPPTTNAWGMLYGVIILTLIALLQGVPFTIDMHPQYLGSLFYLAIPGSVVAFTTYLLLVGRIGADKAAYSTVMFPAVALTVSTFFEGYQWTLMAVAGFVLVVAGNIIIFARRRNG